jgi:hypothetical protein
MVGHLRNMVERVGEAIRRRRVGMTEAGIVGRN